VAELGIQGKPVIVVPSPFLAGGHQLKNAEVLAGKGAAVVVQEEQMDDAETGLEPTIANLLNDAPHREVLAKNLHEQIIPDSARQLAVIILEQANIQTKE